MEGLVVIGGTAGGMSAAARARRGDASLPITVFDRSGFVTYGSCGLPYYISDDIKDHNELVTYTPAYLKQNRNIDVKIHHEVTHIDTLEKYIIVKDLKADKEFKQPYNKLVIATGASPMMPPIPGIDLENILTLRNIEDGVRIKELIKSGKIKKAAILGGGFIGLEMAEALRKQNIEVAVFEMLPQILPQIDGELLTLVEQDLDANNVKLFKNTKVIGFESSEDGKVSRVIVEGNRSYDVDMVLVSVGVRPNTDLAAKAGIETGLKGSIVVDEYMRTSLKDIWACGDCVQSYHRITKKPVYIPLGTTANKQGKIVGDNVLGGNTSFSGVMGTQVTKIFDTFVASTGLTEAEARAMGIDATSAIIKHSDKAGYYPGKKPIYIKITMDKPSGRVLGAQLIGSEGVGKRVDIFVTAITAGMTVYDMDELDLAYAPPVSPVYDPVLIAASVGIKTLEKREN